MALPAFGLPFSPHEINLQITNSHNNKSPGYNNQQNTNNKINQ